MSQKSDLLGSVQPGTDPVRAGCRECRHRWIVAYVPMELDRFVRVLAGARCPACGGDRCYLEEANR